MPTLWIIAGPNGAGKSTLVADVLRARWPRLPIINPDDIAAQSDAPHSSISAGRIALARQQQLLAGRQSFAVETTLSGSSTL